LHHHHRRRRHHHHPRSSSCVRNSIFLTTASVIHFNWTSLAEMQKQWSMASAKKGERDNGSQRGLPS
jgi:hypothetical protein